MQLESDVINSTSGNKNEQIVAYEPIEGTPFTLVKQESNYCLAIGRFIITENCESKEQALDQLKTKQWEITMNMIITMQQVIEEASKSKLKNH